MAYLHQTDFSISSAQLGELEIGSSLERVLGYLKTLLPSASGFISACAFCSVDQSPRVHLQVSSVWDTWEDLAAHRQSSLSEAKILREFEPHVQIADLNVSIYREVG